MKAILSNLGKLSLFNSNPIIPHFRINFPLPTKNIQECMYIMSKYYKKSPPAIFLSLNGISESPENCQIIHDTIRSTAQREKVKVYAFLEDHVTALTYYVATSADFISVNPYCRIGDFTAPHKSYQNIEKLMDYFGIECERIGTKETNIWNKWKAPTEDEKEFSRKWLSVVSRNMRQRIIQNRKINTQVIDQFGSKLINPNKALELKLVDNIGTLEEYKVLNFPNNKLKLHTFSDGKKPAEFNKAEVQVLTKAMQIIQMPKVALMSMEDPLNEFIQGFVKIIQTRAQNPQSLVELDTLIGELLSQLKLELSNQTLILQ